MPVKSVIETPNSPSELFTQLLEKSFHKSLQPGELATGEVLKIEKDHLLVDIGGKCEGLIPVKEIPGCENEADLNEQFTVGQVIESYILRSFEDETPYLLSLKRVSQRKDWDILEEYAQSGQTISVKALTLSRGGLLVQAMNLRGFVPGSQIRVAKPVQELIGENFEAKVLEVDRNRNKLILSQREAQFEKQSQIRVETLSALSVGELVEGQVLKITDFGAFVDVNGIDGLLPLSEISWRRISHPSDELQLGDQVQVRVLNIDMEKQRISLSRKRLANDPWLSITERVEVGKTLEGKVSKFLGTGYLVEIEAGVEGFSSFNHHQSREEVTMGETRSFEVVSVDAQERRITLQPNN